jgi:hypothetical protein
MTARLFDADAGASGVLCLSPAGVSRRVWGMASLLALVLVMMMLVVSSSAFGSFTRPEVGSFGPSGAAGFGSASQLTLDQSGHKLYALDAGAGLIDDFDVSTAGTYALLSGGFPVTVTGTSGAPDVAVDNSAAASAGDLYYLSESSGLYGFTAAGVDRGGNFPVSGFGDPCGAAVDPSGNVWVGDYGTQSVKEFTSAGAPAGSVDTSAQGNPCHVAFDANGDLYAAMYNGPVWKYTAAGGYATATLIDASPTPAVTVDRVNHEVYAVHGGHVSVSSAAGAPLYDFADGIANASLSGVAVDEATDRAFVSDSSNGTVHVFGPLATIADATTGDATDVTLSDATLNGTVNPDGLAIIECHFDYGTDTTYGHSAPCAPSAASIPADHNDHAVAADLSGLDPSTTYHVRLVVQNVNATGSGTDTTFTTLGAGITNGRIQEAGADSATLTAQINPNGQSTTYHLEYGTDTSYGQSTPESPPIGADNTNHPIRLTLTGLAPGTTYHWRVVATSAAGIARGSDHLFATHASTPAVAPCANDQLRTGPGARLPDCRAYEQASPSDKQGASIQHDVNLVQASAAGDRITFLDNAGLLTTGGSSTFPTFVASRGAATWSTNGLLPATDPGFNAFALGWSDDIGTSVSFVNRASGGVLSVGDTAAGTWQQAFTAPACCQNPHLAAFAADRVHLIFEDNAALTPDAVDGISDGRDNLYDLDHGAVTLAGRVPPFPATRCDDATHAPDCVAPTGGSFAGPNGGVIGSYYTPNTISADGSKVFFTEGGTGRLYMRSNGTSTTQISASVASIPDPHGHRPATFLAATPSGSKVFFSSCERLTDDATAVSTGADDCTSSSQGQDLYVYDTASGELTDLTADTGSDVSGAAVQGFLGTSSDGAYVYFMANGVLASGATPGECRIDGSQSGNCNLYLAHAGVITYLAGLRQASSSVDDYANWRPSATGARGDATKSSRVSPGGTLLFSSVRSLTGYDNTAPTCISGQPGPCHEIYRYRPGDAAPACISCDPTGAPPTGNAVVEESRVGGSAAEPVLKSLILTRNISVDGNRIFFDSPDALVNTDTNGVIDVYEWEADGSGTCETAGGCVYLLSTGASPEPSYLGDISASGDDAFIFTDQALVPADQDQLTDVYDVRVGGGLASQHAVAPRSCSGDACQGAPVVASASLPAASLTFAGPGTVAPTRPGKPKVSKPKAVRGTSALLSIRLSEPGKLTISGSGLTKAAKTAAKAGTYKIRVSLTPTARRTLQRKHQLSVKTKVVFAPSGGTSSTATVTLTFKAAKTKRGH